MVEAGWSAALYHVDPFRALDFKLRSVAKTLKSWSAQRIGSIRLQLAIAREVILGLDVTEESRLLSDHEKILWNELKFKCLGLTSLNRTILRQRSKLLYLAKGDANTRFFHLQACHRNRKNTISRLRVDKSVLVQNEELEAALHSHFDSLLGQPFQRLGNIGLHRLGLPTIELDQLEVLFTEQEVWETIASMPSDRAPGPDGFTGIFYKTAWPIIKADIIRAFNAFWARDFRSLNLLNEAFMILLRKKDTPEVIKDYRPISLIHSFSKLVAKCLANRLAKFLNSLVSPNQSTFIRGRSIHDNFRSVQLACRYLHSVKRPSILFKG